MLKILFIIGVVAGIIIVANTIMNSNGSKSLFGFFPADADQSQKTGRPLETVPKLIQKQP